MSFHVKNTYLSHLKKCSNQNNVQLKHVVGFAAKTINESKAVTKVTKSTGKNIKNRTIKLEIPQTEDDEQQQLVKSYYKNISIRMIADFYYRQLHFQLQFKLLLSLRMLSTFFRLHRKKSKQ